MKKVKKIAINATIIDEQPTGLGIVALNIINRLPLYLSDCAIDVFTTTDVGFSKELNLIIVSKYLKSSKYKIFAGILRFLWNQVYLFFKASEYDLVYCPTPHGNFFRRNQIITIHDLIPLNAQGKYSPYFLQKMYYKFFLKRIIQVSKAVISVSKNTKVDIETKLNIQKDVCIVYNGYDERMFNMKADSNVPRIIANHYILAIGATYGHKNLKVLISAFDNLNKDFPDYSLIIAGGKAKYISELKDFISLLDAEVQRKIIIFDYVSSADIINLYRNASCFVYPSLYEGFGLPILEAIASGCPVVCSKINIFEEIFGNAVLYFNPNSYEDIRRRITQVLKSNGKNVGDTLKKNEIIEKLTWDNSAKQIATIIKNNL